MASNFWVVFALVATCAIITDGVVKIIKASKSGNSKEGLRRLRNWKLISNRWKLTWMMPRTELKCWRKLSLKRSIT